MENETSTFCSMNTIVHMCMHWKIREKNTHSQAAALPDITLNVQLHSCCKGYRAVAICNQEYC